MNSEALPFLKARLGITRNNRDEYLQQILVSVESELKNRQGIVLLADRPDHLMFLVDYAEYRYSNRDTPAIPRHLQWRLHNLLLEK